MTRVPVNPDEADLLGSLHERVRALEMGDTSPPWVLRTGTTTGVAPGGTDISWASTVDRWGLCPSATVTEIDADVFVRVEASVVYESAASGGRGLALELNGVEVQRSGPFTATASEPCGVPLAWKGLCQPGDELVVVGFHSAPGTVDALQGFLSIECVNNA